MEKEIESLEMFMDIIWMSNNKLVDVKVLVKLSLSETKQ